MLHADAVSLVVADRRGAAMERVLFVHAHPDDESIFTGGTIATLVDRGAAVTVITCTRGERGGVVAPELAHLEGTAALADLRELELAAALVELGVTDHRWLGEPDARWADREPRRYEDSGMPRDAGVASPAAPPPGSLTAADPGEVAADIAAVIAATGPDVVVSYDSRGGYGHPDHIRAHEAARTAADVLGVPFFAIQAVIPAPGSMRVDVTAVLDRKRAAMAAHRSQLAPAPTASKGPHLPHGAFALGDGGVQPVNAEERFARMREAEPSFTDFSLGSRIGSCAVALLLGLFAGGLLTVVHQATVAVADVTVPWGIVAALVITAALVAGLRLVFGSRIVAAFAAVGLLAAVVVLSTQSSGGSLLVPGNPAGFVWVFAPVVIPLVVLVWPGKWPRRAGRIAPVRVEGREVP
jgi:N-acetyl-1-D-myo-inositol-2-amino-2-deoxy-alpha-D-glucopyranoside deacetylase